MTAAIQSERNRGSRKGARAETVRSCRGGAILSVVAIVSALRYFGELWEGPFPPAPSPDEVDAEAYRQQESCVANLAYRIRTLPQDKYKSGDREQGGKRKQPHAKWSSKLRPSNAQHDDPDGLNQKLQ